MAPAETIFLSELYCGFPGCADGGILLKLSAGDGYGFNFVADYCAAGFLRAVAF